MNTNTKSDKGTYTTWAGVKWEVEVGDGKVSENLVGYENDQNHQNSSG